MATITKRTNPSGKTVWVAGYTDASGTRRKPQFPTRKEADAYLVRVRAEVSQGTHTSDTASITVSEASAFWLEKCEADGLEQSTTKAYSEHVKLHILPLLGTQKLSRLTVPVIETFKDDLLKTRSRPMVRRVLTSLKGIIKEARRKGFVAQNVAEGVSVDMRRSEEEEAAIPTKEQIRLMLKTAPEIFPLVKIRHGRWVRGKGCPEITHPLPWRPLIILAIFTGLRASEIRGLTWANVDLSSGVVQVRQRADLWGKIGVPKSRAGRRDIHLAPMVVNVLREWKIACPPTKLDLVFPSETGGVLTHPNLTRQGFVPLLKACGLWSKNDGGAFNFHSLRHAAASLYIEQGWDAKRVQTVMGHSSVQVTFDVYGHLFPSRQNAKDAMAKLQADLLETP